ncbi:PhzF family phenazine biosynthesis protein [Saxibacter everestensis]|uniref:PhzF family phenazine biosynthesis protein n=1 Tax=Saxibacter everestensis TaxID=2909229 RepID=A0ABY8QXU4_9MICO|nr:PhzF family phenazine biosynthesis protein [Brevibacteriaceae bacterium ZFBP1038]
MGTLKVDVVRVFTDESGNLGNELGIVRSGPASAGREQDIAARLGFSETVFLEAVASADSAASGGTAALRIFTPTTELPFAGHPSVGTAWWLREQGTGVGVLHEPAGDVAVEYDGTLTWISAKPNWAPKFEWLPQDSADAVEGFDGSEFSRGHHYVYAWADEAAGRLRSRMFAPAMGIAEDEATGAAAVRVTEKLGRDLQITQGSGSQLFTKLDGDFVRVGGATVFDRSLELDV